MTTSLTAAQARRAVGRESIVTRTSGQVAGAAAVVEDSCPGVRIGHDQLVGQVARLLSTSDAIRASLLMDMTSA